MKNLYVTSKRDQDGCVLELRTSGFNDAEQGCVFSVTAPSKANHNDSSKATLEVCWDNGSTNNPKALTAAAIERLRAVLDELA